MGERAYRIEPGELLAEGLRRAARGRADKALQRLREDTGEDFAKTVHGARKDLKKLRSLLRLIRDGLGEQAYRRQNDRLREAAHSLGAARDAEAKLEGLQRLKRRYRTEFPSRWSRDLIGALERERDEIAATEAEAGTEPAAAVIEAGLREIDVWALHPDSFELVAPGLQRAYKRGRKRFADALEQPTDGRVHEWRKRVKDLWYQLRLLQRAWPELLGPISEQAHQLSSLLGDHHDLAVIRAEVEGRPECFGGTAQTQLLELIARRQGELVDQATPLGRRLYAEKPKHFRHRIDAYWTAG